MARFNNQKRGGDGTGRDQEAADKEVEEKKDAEGAELEPEKQRNRAQDQLGNQAIQSMMADLASGGGLEVEAQVRKAKPHDKEGVDYGGTDDADPGPITIHDLAQTWNPGLRRTEDRPSFLESMPDDELPPEDESFVEACADGLPEGLPGSASLDERLAPSTEVVRIALTPWARAAGTWASPDLTSQLLRRVIAPPVPALQDPHGRVLLSRSRAASIAVALLLDAPVMRRARDEPTATALAFALELAARLHRVKAVEVLAEENKGQSLPVALDIFHDGRASESAGRVLPRSATVSGFSTLAGIVSELVRYEEVDTLVPLLAVEHPAPDPDDPLGLDSVIDEMTGGRPDPEALLYDASIQIAERIASAAARSRVLYAGVGLAVAEVAEHGAFADATDNLADAMAAFDRDVASCLQLLLEIARTAQRRAVPPAGLHTGLRRAAKALGKLRDRGTRALVEVIWGILPGEPDLAPTTLDIPDAVLSALTSGQPTEALPWLREQPPSLDRDTAVALTRAAAGALPPELVGAIGDLRARWRHERPDSLIGTALDVFLGALLLFEGRLDDALSVADAIATHGDARRNGLWIAEGALLGLEVHLARGDHDALDARRLDAGRRLHALGARGALSLLARWQPPDLDPDDDA